MCLQELFTVSLALQQYGVSACYSEDILLRIKKRHLKRIVSNLISELLNSAEIIHIHASFHF